MRLAIILVIIAFVASVSESRIVVKREVEREGQPKETILVTDKNDGNDVEVINGNGNGNGREVIEFDLDDRGVLAFGGRIPAFDFDNFNQRMNEMVASMLRRMQEMHKRVNETVAKYPNNYNNTNVEIVEIGGRQYRKETTVINRRINGMTIFSKSTTLVPVEDESGSSEDVEKVDPKSERPKATDKEAKKNDDLERES